MYQVAKKTLKERGYKLKKDGMVKIKILGNYIKSLEVLLLEELDLEQVIEQRIEEIYSQETIKGSTPLSPRITD